MKKVLIDHNLLGAGGKSATSPKKSLPTATTLTPKTTVTGSKAITPIIHLPSGTTGINEKDEESVSAIQSFINATSDKNAKIQLGDDLKVPKGVKITSAGKGVVNIRAVAESSSSTNASVTSPNIVATGRGIVSPRGKGSPSSRGRGFTSNSAATAAVAVPKASDIPKGAVKTVTLTAGGIIKRAVPQGRIAGTTNITSTVTTSPTITPNSQTKEEAKQEASNEETIEQIEAALKEGSTEDKKEVIKSPTVNGSKSNNVSTPNSRGRNKGNKSPSKSISSPIHQDKDNIDSSDSPVKDGPKIIRLKSNSVTEVMKSNSSPSGNLSPSNDEVTSKTNSTPLESNKRKTAPSTPTNTSNLDSPSESGSRSKRARKEKKIFDL